MEALEKKTRDMTSGPVLPQILSFMIPVLLGNLFQQFYNVVDAMIVGRLLGAKALAAVGSTTSVQFLVLGFCMGSCAGFGIPVSQKFGAKQANLMRRYIYHSAVVTMIIACTLTLLTCCMCGKIIDIMRTPADIERDAYQYLLIIFIGIPFTLLYNLTASILRSVGNSRIPFIFLAVSTILNIFLDLFCVAVLNLGCAGAAIATVMSQALSGLGCLFYILGTMKEILPDRKECKWSTDIAKNLLLMGLPMGFQYSITAIGSMVMQSANNSLGSVYVSAFTAGTKVKQLMLCPFDSIATAMATFVGQNVGARNMDRIKSGIRQTLFAAIAYSAFAFVVMTFFGKPLAALFVSVDNSDVIDAAASYMAALGAFYWLLAILIVFRYAIQAIGFSMLSVISGILEMLARSLVSTIFVPMFGYTAICFTDQSAWIAATIFLVFMLHRLLRKIVVDFTAKT